MALVTIPGFLLLFALYKLVFIPLLPEGLVYNEFLVLFLLVSYLISALGFFDFLAYKVGKKRKLVKKIFTPLANLFSYLNATRLFVWELYSIFTKYGKLSISLVLMLILSLSVVVSINELSRYFNASALNINFSDSRRYFDNNGYPTIYAQDYSLDNPLILNYYNVSIPSEVVKDKYLPVFVSYNYNMDETFTRVMDSLQINKPELNRKDAKIAKEMLANLIRVEIDGESYKDLNWFRTEDLQTKIDGFKAYVRIEDLSPGEHSLDVGFLMADFENPIERRDYFVLSSIFFYKE